LEIELGPAISGSFLEPFKNFLYGDRRTTTGAATFSGRFHLEPIQSQAVDTAARIFIGIVKFAAVFFCFFMFFGMLGALLK
jgi:hypothetical protein